MTRNQTVEINHLTVLQIQYLTELEQLEKGRGTIGAVAAKCGVKHPTVITEDWKNLQKAICESIKKFKCKKNRIRLET